MLLDIRPDHLQIVQTILRQHVPNSPVWAFGSRAKWTAKDHSDLDLCVVSDKPLDFRLLGALTESFSDSDLPYMVDIVDWATTSESFRKIITRDKVVVQEAGGGERWGSSAEWHSSTLGEFVRLQRGHDLTASEQQPGDIPIMGSAGPNGTHSTALANGPGVVVGRSGASAGRVHFSSVDYWPHNTCLYVTDFLGNSPRFAYYLLQTLDLASFNSGSAQPSLNRNFLYAIPVKIPARVEQDGIVALLKSLDDRITLLRETNATLEAIAQALFKSWFVDFDPVRAKMEGRAPEGMDEDTARLFPDALEESELGLMPRGWRVGTLGDVAQTVRQQLQPSDLHADINYVGLEHIPRKSLSLVSWGTADGLESAKATFGEGDILFGKLRPYFHKVVIAPFDGVCSTDVLVCQAKKPAHYGFVVMQLFSTTLIEYAERLSNGAKMPRVGWKDIAAYPVVIPSEPVAGEYTKAIEPLLARIKANVQQAQTLATLRDTLLPRLVSGQLRLPKVDLPIQEAAT